VTLRPWQHGDVAALVDCLDGDETISRWLDMIPQPYRAKEALLWIDQAASYWREGSAAPFALVAAESGEVGYWIRRDERGQGLTTRGLNLISRWAIETLGCERVQLRADEDNAPSQRVAERAGFQREGILRSVHYNARLGRRVNYVMYSLLPSELPGRPA